MVSAEGTPIDFIGQPSDRVGSARTRRALAGLLPVPPRSHGYGRLVNIHSFAEYERALIAARTRAALAAKRRRGERVSGLVPFGHQLAVDGRTLMLEDAEQRTVQTMSALREAGGSMRGIADHLNQIGLRTRAGSPWQWEYVRRVLKRINAAAA
jgi:hypothetical protein